MDFSSLRRKTNEGNKEKRKKTFSISNISCTSGSSTTTVIRKSLNITLPRDLDVQQDVDGRVLKVSKGGSAHISGVIQVGDLINVFPNDLDLRHSPIEDCPLSIPDDEFVNVNILYGLLQVDNRPLCPLMVEIGNRNNTSLGLALADSPGEKIRISSIQPGSLAERCGFLKPGDVLISIQVKESETMYCSPYYTSYEIAQILRRITTSTSSVTLTILPYEAEQLQLQQQHRSLFSMLTKADCNRKYKDSGSESTLIPDSGPNNDEAAIGPFNDSEEDNATTATHETTSYTILSFSLWKDRLYEDWGFSLTDSVTNQEDPSKESNSDDQGARNSLSTSTSPSKKKPSLSLGNAESEILQIRPGGPAYSAGLLSGDRILQINHQDVSTLESTMLVPILASLDDSLNLTIVRIQDKSTS